MVRTQSVEVTVSAEAEEELEEYSESDRFVLVDPGDYAEAQKIRAIFQAEKECRDIILENPRWNIIKERALMSRVQHFAVQLWPIIFEAIEAEIITESDVEIMSHNIQYSDVQAFVQGNYWDLPERYFHERKHETHNPAYKSVKAQVSIIIFNHLSMMKQKLGLGLKMDKIKAPAEV
jgi:hypothetical protein